MAGSNPAALSPPDPVWATRGAEALDVIAESLSGLPGAAEATFDHIGSTSVPGLAAKPLIDLQVRILPLPSQSDLVNRLGRLGYEEAVGARPDSPGVHRDLPRPGDPPPDDELWEKRLLTNRDQAVILHVRRSDSPWGLYTVWFRDWLRADPDARARYEAVKRTLAEQNVGKPDYDDYTRAKTEFFDEVHPVFCQWAREQWSGNDS